MASSPLSSWALVALASFLVYRYSSGASRGRKLPPGPKPLPLVGNVLDFPAEGELEFQHWLKHKDLYGPISSVTLLGTTLVLVHDREAASVLLDKMASKTSGRPSMVFAGEMCGYDKLMICQGYNDEFRRYRRFTHREIGTKASATRFQSSQEIEINRQLARTLSEPEKWLQHIRTTAGATILRIAYGYAVGQNESDTLVDMTENVLKHFSLASTPMSWAVDIIPILRYLPDSFPGATFKKTAREWRKSIEDVAHVPYRFVQRQMAANSHRESYVSRLIQQHAKDGATDPSPEDEKPILWTAASLYGAAADTTVITLTAFTAAMTLFPEVQRKAQEEIDRVVGSDRLPGIADRENLPYTNAVVKEAIRWWPVGPMGFPHMATADIEYEGLLIPKGAYILPASWWFLHDPDVYADPDPFNPERFLAPRSEPDPAQHTFGYGRRLCPGRFLADSNLYLSIAQTLATFNINKAVDKDGRDIDVDFRAKPGILCFATDFQFKVTPRSQKHVDLIRRLETENLWDESDAHLLEPVLG